MAGSPSWWGLYDTYQYGIELQEQWRANPLPSCPNDGEPLIIGPDGIRFCRFDGWNETQRRRTD